MGYTTRVSPSDEYFAGFVDGEGSIGAHGHKNSRHKQIRVQTVNTHRAVLEAMRARFGGYIVTRRIVAGHAQTWCHTVTGQAAYEMVRALRPFLLVKADRADEMLALREPKDNERGPLREPRRQKTHCKHGHAFDEANTRITPTGKRVCRACERERERQRRPTPVVRS